MGFTVLMTFTKQVVVRKKHQPSFFLGNKETKELIMEIDRSANMMNGDSVRVKGASCIIATRFLTVVPQLKFH